MERQDLVEVVDPVLETRHPLPEDAGEAGLAPGLPGVPGLALHLAPQHDPPGRGALAGEHGAELSRGEPGLGLKERKLELLEGHEVSASRGPDPDCGALVRLQALRVGAHVEQGGVGGADLDREELDPGVGDEELGRHDPGSRAGAEHQGAGGAESVALELPLGFLHSGGLAQEVVGVKLPGVFPAPTHRQLVTGYQFLE